MSTMQLRVLCRAECYEYSASARTWRLSPLRLGTGTGFPASAGPASAELLVVGGGREYTGDQEQPWSYLPGAPPLLTRPSADRVQD